MGFRSWTPGRVQLPCASNGHFWIQENNLMPMQQLGMSTKQSSFIGLSSVMGLSRTVQLVNGLHLTIGGCGLTLVTSHIIHGHWKPIDITQPKKKKLGDHLDVPRNLIDEAMNLFNTAVTIFIHSKALFQAVNDPMISCGRAKFKSGKSLRFN